MLQRSCFPTKDGVNRPFLYAFQLGKSPCKLCFDVVENCHFWGLERVNETGSLPLTRLPAHYREINTESIFESANTPKTRETTRFLDMSMT